MTFFLRIQIEVGNVRTLCQPDTQHMTYMRNVIFACKLSSLAIKEKLSEGEK